MKRRDTLSPDGPSLGKQHRSFKKTFKCLVGIIHILTFSFLTSNTEVWSIKPFKQIAKNTSGDIVNEMLPGGQYLLIDETGNKLGLFDKNQVLSIAGDRGFDVLVVSTDSKPMVAKLLDYSKHRYEQQKKLKEMKKNQRVVQIKEIRLSPTIDKHDMETKAKMAMKFLSAGDKVKISLRFRGRMITHKEIGKAQMDSFIEMLSNITIESPVKLEGNTLIAVVAPAKSA